LFGFEREMLCVDAVDSNLFRELRLFDLTFFFFFSFFQLSLKTGVPVSQIERFAIWGNHSTTMVPDVNHVQVRKKERKKERKRESSDCCTLFC
jgi:hypothetical protein